MGWNGRKPVPQTDFPRPAGVTMESVCKYSGMAATSACGQTREIPFLEGTTPKPDNVHSKGCFDIAQEIRNDDRRPQDWIDSAQEWADRLVNGQLGSVGDPTKLKENANYRLGISPVLGNPGYGQPICGHVVFVPKPTHKPGDSGHPQPSGDGGPGQCHGNPRKCSPRPRIQQDAGAAAVMAPTSLAVLVPVFAVSAGAWLLPLLGRAARRRRR